MHAGHVNHFGLAHVAIAGVGQHGRGVYLQRQQLGHYRGSRYLGVVVGHVRRLRHEGRHQQRIAQHIDVFFGSGLEGLKVDLAPAAIGIRKAGLQRQRTGAHGWQYVQHVCRDIVLQVESQRAGFAVHTHYLLLGAVLDHAGIQLGPGFFKQGAFGGDVRVGVKNQDLGPRLVQFEPGRDQTGAFVRSGWTAVRSLGNCDGEHATVNHRMQLRTQCHGLGASLPCLQNLAVGVGLL